MEEARRSKQEGARISKQAREASKHEEAGKMEQDIKSKQEEARRSKKKQVNDDDDESDDDDMMMI